MSFIYVIAETGGQGTEQGFKVRVDGSNLLSACSYEVSDAAVCYKGGTVWGVAWWVALYHLGLEG